MKKLILLNLIIFSLSFAFDGIKEGWFLSLNANVEYSGIYEQIYDNTAQKTISKDDSYTGFGISLDFGYQISNILLGVGGYYTSIGNPKLLANKNKNDYFNIWESGAYGLIGINFKEKHYIKLLFITSSITGEEKFPKDTTYFNGGGSIFMYSYEVVNHLMISPYIKMEGFVSDNEWSNKMAILSIGFQIGWQFY